MARRRSLSTNISIDKDVNRLAAQAGDFAALLYTWMIPHAEDDCRLTGDPEELLAKVLPFRRDKTAEDVAEVLSAMAGMELISWFEENGKKVVEFPSESFYAYQSYIPTHKRRECRTDATALAGGVFAAEHRRTPQNTASPSPSLSPTKDSPIPTLPPEGEGIMPHAKSAVRHVQKHAANAATKRGKCGTWEPPWDNKEEWHDYARSTFPNLLRSDQSEKLAKVWKRVFPNDAKSYGTHKARELFEEILQAGVPAEVVLLELLHYQECLDDGSFARRETIFELTERLARECLQTDTQSAAQYRAQVYMAELGARRTGQELPVVGRRG